MTQNNHEHPAPPKPAAPQAVRLALGAAVVVIAVGALAIGFVREGSRRAEQRAVQTAAAAASVPATAPESPGVVTVYYFHGDFRCKTCLAIEAQTTDVVQRIFADEIAAGLLRFEILNFDDPANAPIRDRYDLAYSTVILQNAHDAARWEDLADVWTRITEGEPVFEQYLVEHITAMLDGDG
jgi:hypothetical protein